MSRADCFRALGVDPNTSWDGIRQAYKDLVRVWHPDRFQFDPQLQSRAEQQLRRVNEAYFALKNAHLFEDGQPEPAPPSKPDDPGPAVNERPHPRSSPDRFAWNLLLRWPIRVAWLGLICLAPLVIGTLLVDKLRVTTLESSILQNGQPSPGIPTPSLAGEFSSWARGKAMDLWQSIPKIGERPSERLVQRADTRTAAPGTPENGTELLRTRMSGGSQMWVSNQANQDAVATLADADTLSPIRVIYVQAKNKACIRRIAPGLYTLLAETGENWDSNHTRFQTGRRALGRNGPFQCIDLTEAHVTSGQCVDVSSTEGDASRPKYNIVLGNRRKIFDTNH